MKNISSTLEHDAHFSFGKNWRSFLRVVDERRIVEAEKNLSKMLQINTLEGLSFLDIGCGSGLSSLAARRLGATVHSFDSDTESVACAEELRRLYFPNDMKWTIEKGNVLDKDYISYLPKFDIVYSWGVLHHTGAMWQALEIVCIPIVKEGRLFISIYKNS